MGACYSKSGHDADIAKKKSPHSKKHKTGIAVTIEYSPVRAPNHNEDRLSIFDNEEEDDKIVVESNGNVEGQCCSKVSKDSNKVVLNTEGENGDIDGKCDLVTLQERSKEVKTSDSDVIDKVVSASDSGVESLTAQESHHSSQSLCDKTKPYQTNDEVDTLVSQKNEIHENHETKDAEASAVPISPESLPCSPIRQHLVSPDGVNLELTGSKRASQELRPRSIMKVRFDSEASLELTSTFPRLQDVKTMQMDGKDMVVIDVETYSHIMEELAMLKMKLSQLTDFLQVRKYQI
ncbi:uncharacterized protein LOC125671779 isoform X5 [Ostrea edulis]|uniref:uncharacterized protein LOC125671779 isoform X5 n=1 Tax=Ostrea edulis TaxID=37623 RepID=UPI0024AF01B5|nr:uncharacterized protein LOC125671779 isoform X5 [Ostrea edulis]